MNICANTTQSRMDSSTSVTVALLVALATVLAVAKWHHDRNQTPQLPPMSIPAQETPVPDAAAARAVQSDGVSYNANESKPVGKFEYMFDPRYNMREAAKQLLLLEDHIAFPAKQCPDCVRKHILFTEGLLEEAVTLDKVGIHTKFVMPIIGEFRRLSANFASERFVRSTYLQQGFRAIRKRLQNYSFDTVAPVY